MNGYKAIRRIVAVGIALATMAWPGEATAQTINLTFKDRPMPEALKSIERAGGKDIIFSYGDLEKYRVTATIKQKTEAEAIRIIIDNKPLTMQERERYFVIRRNDRVGEMTEISGKVTDNEGQPLPYSTVLLLDGDSTLIGGCATDGNGTFYIAADRCPEVVKASFVGYKSGSVSYRPGHNVTIALQPDAIALEGVVVTNERPLVASTDRGLLASISGTPLAKMGTASEMITHLPLVMSDGTVAGRGKPEIYINNKKVRDASELDRLRADEIITAEVITLPGVEYGAEVTSVIRLRTARRSGEGWSGSLAAAYSKGEEAAASQNVAQNYRTRGGLDLFVRVHAAEQNSIVTAVNEDRLQASKLWKFDRNSSFEGENNNFSTDLGFNWEINENHSVGMTYTAAGLMDDGISRNQAAETVSQNGRLTEFLDNSSETRTKPKLSHALNAYYVGRAGKWDIDFSADLYNARSLSEMVAETNGTPAAASTTRTKNLLVAEKLTAVTTFGKSRLILGEETSYVDRTGVFTQDGFSADNETRQQTTVWSLFAEWSMQVGAFALSAGLRWQNELNGYDTNGKRDDDMSRDYSVLLPRLSATYTHGEWRHTLAFNASRYNPPYSMLTTTVDYRSKYEYFTGNPFLLPQTTSFAAYTLAWRWLYVQPYYAYTKNPIRTFQHAYDDASHPGVIITEYRNAPRMQNYGIMVNLSPKIGPWQMNYTVNLGFNDEDVEPLGITQNWNDLCVSLNLDNSFSLPQGWMLNLTGSLTPYSRHNTAKMKTTGSVDLRLNKSFLKNGALNVALTANDIFKTAYIEMTAYGGIDVSTQFKQYNDTRRVGIDIAYKFNATNNRYKGSHAGQSERQRL